MNDARSCWNDKFMKFVIISIVLVNYKTKTPFSKPYLLSVIKL